MTLSKAVSGLLLVSSKQAKINADGRWPRDKSSGAALIARRRQSRQLD
jgi:hypothetical protein